MPKYTIYGPEKWEKYYVDYVYDYLLSKGYEVKIIDKMSFKLDVTCADWYGVLRKNIIFQNDETKQFFCINHADQHYNVSEIVEHPLCVGVLKCQYRSGSYGKFEHKVSSFTYGVKEKENYFSIRKELAGIKEKRLYFKGNEVARQNIMERLAEMQLINPDWGYRDKNGNKHLKVSQKEYLLNIFKSKIALSIPGAGNCCHREIEAFGVGTPVLMPVLRNQYYNNLIPNFHYIAIDVPDKEIRSYTKKEVDTVCNSIKVRYEEIVENDDYLDEISKNALIWFQQNIEYPHNMELLEKVLLERFKYSL